MVRPNGFFRGVFARDPSVELGGLVSVDLKVNYQVPHEANLFDMNAKYADVVSEQEALTYIAAQKRK